MPSNKTASQSSVLILGDPERTARVAPAQVATTNGASEQHLCNLIGRRRHSRRKIRQVERRRRRNTPPRPCNIPRTRAHTLVPDAVDRITDDARIVKERDPRCSTSLQRMSVQRSFELTCRVSAAEYGTAYPAIEAHHPDHRRLSSPWWSTPL